MKDFVLRLCFRMYPSTIRERDGRAIIDLARDLSSQSRLAFLREAGGMIVGGIQVRGRLLRLDLTGAPWHAARERLALPLAVGMLCVIVAFIALALPRAHIHGWWVDGWALLFLVAAGGAVVGAAFGRRYLTMTASCVLLVLMTLDALLLLADSNREQWRMEANIGMGGVGVFAMWLPVALLLIICAGAVGGASRARGRDKALIICLPVVVSALVAARWQSLLGAVLLYAPLALVAGMVIRGAVRKDPVTRTAGALLVAASCFPVLWLLAFVVPYPSALEPWFPLIYFGSGALVACVVVRFLLGDRVRIPA